VNRPAGPTPAWFWERTWIVDLSVTTMIEALVVLSMGHDGERRWWVWLLAQLLVLPLLVRRRQPVAVFGLLSAVALVQWALGVRFVADVALLVALYTVASTCERAEAITAAAVVEVGVVLASVRFAPAGDGVLGSIVFLTGLATAALFLGTTLQARRAYLASLEDRAHRLERERDQQTQLAATAERTRIAREMHDVVAHSLSVVITLADAAVAARASEPVEADRAMHQVASTGRQALAEMRRILGVLRDGAPAELSPQPTLARLDALLEDVRGAGVPVELTVSGVPQALPVTAEASVYRIVQESLTNVLKHARRPSQVDVSLAWSDDQLVVEVSDDGRAASARAVAASGGHGLQGMRERVALFGGELDAGPQSPHGWVVRARLQTGSELR
jgi:signal transduction histidine kinase